MKNLIITIAILLPYSIFSQITEINVETLASTEKEYRRWNGKAEKIQLKLIAETDVKANKTEKYVTIEINSQEVQEVYSTVNVGSVGKLLGIGIGSTTTTNKYHGHFIIPPSHFGAIREFLNNTLKKKASNPANDFSYSLGVDERLTISLVFKKTLAGDAYNYYLRLDDAWFTIPFEEGISLMRKLLEYQEKTK